MESITILKQNANFVKMQTITISGLHCTIFALASSTQSYLVSPILISLQLTSCKNIALVFITFIGPLTSQTQYPTEFIMFHDRPLSTHQQLSQVSLRWTLQYERCILGP